ncbi:MAG: enoyl-CoA hydratase/isomerase family protein, partial [Magnetospirillum sp.]|nr:enoyl-CoA hydratase/isomerase family protein [Magnetospirillum sp.]
METECLRQGRLGVVRLNRPHALNALAPSQFLTIHRQLAAWAADDQIGAVLLEGAGDRAFCAGGDIRAVWDARGRGDDALNRQLFRDEYCLDRFIHHYPKPIVSLLDGIVMGGGAGISINGGFRVATERSIFAMPETAIGFFPDVGASYFLSRCPGAIGLYLGLTGARLRAADMIWTGLATHFVPADCLDTLKQALILAADAARPWDAIAATLAEAHGEPGYASLSSLVDAINRCFSHDDV